jgi:translation initiation factor eIF-2B subunit delta
MNKIDKELQDILRDKVHGSTELLNSLLNYFIKHQDNIELVKKDLNKIQKKISHFPVIINFINDIEAIVSGKKQISLNTYLKNIKKNDENIYRKIFNAAKPELQNCTTIFTISHSRTIIRIFALWKKFSPKLKVIICESRPNNEGILMAMELSKLGIECEIIPEAMTGTVIKEVDAVILGADQILPNGDIVNKTGSRLMAVLAKYHHIPVYVLASTSKKVGYKIIPPTDKKNKKNNRSKDGIIKLRNYEFEEVEKKLITKIFTD